MTILSILLVVSFVGITIWRKKLLPDSISAMVYDLPEGGWRWLWSVWLVFVSVFTFAPTIEILDGRGMGIMGFVPMVLLCFVAVWPLFDKEHLRWHYILAFVAGVWSQVDVLFICPSLLYVWFAFVVFMCVTFLEALHKVVDMAVFIAECICYAAVVLAEMIIKVG